jgi:PleD family two-component response regulator
MIEFACPILLVLSRELVKYKTMAKQEPKRVLAVVNDLFFSVKISEAAKRNGLALEFVKESGEVLEKAKGKPSLIVFDLNFDAVDPLELITKLKASADTKGVSLLGYLSHLQSELKVKAQDAGCDMVLARSAFSQNMLMIFKRHAGIG